MTNKIKAICFDLDGVFFTPKGKDSFYRALIEEYGGGKEEVDYFLKRSKEMADFKRGKLSKEGFLDEILKIIKTPASHQELVERMVRDYEIDQDVLEAVKSAKKQGYKTCVCTNNDEIKLPLLIERYDLSNFFDVIVSSYQTGFLKPEKEIFKVLLDELKIKGEELVYADDNPDRLSGAKELGIYAFQFHSFKQFLEELKKLGIVL